MKRSGRRLAAGQPNVNPTANITLTLPSDARTDRLAEIGDALHACGVRPVSLTWSNAVGVSDARVWMAMDGTPAQIDELVTKLKALAGATVAVGSDDVGLERSATGEAAPATPPFVD